MFVLSYGTWTRSWTCPINVDLDSRTMDLDLTVAGLFTSLSHMVTIIQSCISKISSPARRLSWVNMFILSFAQVFLQTCVCIFCFSTHFPY